jgi:hypothetical protein
MLTCGRPSPSTSSYSLKTSVYLVMSKPPSRGVTIQTPCFLLGKPPRVHHHLLPIHAPCQPMPAHASPRQPMLVSPPLTRSHRFSVPLCSRLSTARCEFIFTSRPLHLKRKVHGGVVAVIRISLPLCIIRSADCRRPTRYWKCERLVLSPPCRLAHASRETV